MIALVGVVMWCPDSTLGSSNCALKRHLAAVALVLSWAEFVTLVARHPNLARYNIYVTMFYKSDFEFKFLTSFENTVLKLTE